VNGNYTAGSLFQTTMNMSYTCSMSTEIQLDTVAGREKLWITIGGKGFQLQAFVNQTGFAKGSF